MFADIYSLQCGIESAENQRTQIHRGSIRLDLKTSVVKKYVLL